MKVYGIFDRASGMFVDRLLVLPADLAARRVFDEACSDSRSELSKYPDDYELHRVAEFNNETGEITPQRELIARGTKGTAS